MSYVGNIAAGGATHLVGSTLYGTCATAANVAAKVVTCANFDQLLTGVEIRVKFTYSNTVANPTLNVNGTGAKSIYRYGTTAPSTTAATSWQAGAVVSFTYVGANWVMNNNTVYAAATQSADGLMKQYTHDNNYGRFGMRGKASNVKSSGETPLYAPLFSL